MQQTEPRLSRSLEAEPQIPPESTQLRGWMLQMTAVIAYLAVGCSFYMHAEGKPCESAGCEEHCRAAGSNGSVWHDPDGWLDARFGCLERWTLIDALYFCVTTVTTVGYGDFYPKYTKTTIFTFFFINVGVPFISLLICSLATTAGHSVIRMCRAITERFGHRLRQQRGEKRFEALAGSTRRQFVFCTLLPFVLWSYALFAGLQLLFGLAFVQLQPAWREYFFREYGEERAPTLLYFSSVHHCVVTAWTIGYNSGPVGMPGFHEPNAQSARLLSTVHILVSVTYLSVWFDRVRGLVLAQREGRRQAEMLRRECDPALMRTLDRNDDGVDRYEYVTGMLLLMSAVEPALLRRLETRFEQLDVTGDGRLTADDLVQSAHDVRQAAERSVIVQSAHDVRQATERSVIVQSAHDVRQAAERSVSGAKLPRAGKVGSLKAQPSTDVAIPVALANAHKRGGRA